jgi:hypothetical protein
MLDLARQSNEPMTLKERVHKIVIVFLIPSLVTVSIYTAWSANVKTSEIDKVKLPLEKAAYTNEVEVAKQELQETINYIRSTPRLNKMVSGSDSKWQDWYQNLDRQLKNLLQSSQEESALVLLQTNRILLQGDRVRIPPDSQLEKEVGISSVSLLIAILLFQYVTMDISTQIPITLLPDYLLSLFANPFKF